MVASHEHDNVEGGIDNSIEEDTRESQRTTCTWSSVVSGWVDALIVGGKADEGAARNSRAAPSTAALKDPEES